MAFLLYFTIIGTIPKIKTTQLGIAPMNYKLAQTANPLTMMMKF